jgi:hypothetical protein
MWAPSVSLVLILIALHSTACAFNVAVIGGGVGGATLVHFLNELCPGRVNITLLEATDHLGGRLEHWRAPEMEMEHGVELGASVYHDVNRYMRTIVEDTLHLSTTHPYKDVRVGIFDGNSSTFSFVESDLSVLNTALAAVWRYGDAPLKAERAVEDLVQKLLHIYQAQQEGKTYSTAEELLESLGLLDAIRVDSETILRRAFSHSVNAQSPLSESYRRFLDEFVFSLGNINYGQGLELNGLAGMVAMKGKGSELHSVVGGNRQIVERLLERYNGVTVKLNSPVKVKVEQPSSKGARSCRSQYPTIVGLNPTDFDCIVSSHPRPEAGGFKMHQTHVTIVRGRLNESYFRDPLSAESTLVGSLGRLPGVIIAGRHSNATKIEFRSIGRLNSEPNDSRDALFKVFSQEKLTNRFWEAGPFDRGSHVVHEKTWMAYPKLQPWPKDRTTRHPFVLHEGCDDSAQTGVKLPPIFDSGALEFAVSTMETQAIAAKNVGLLIAERWTCSGKKGVNEDDRGL